MTTTRFATSRVALVSLCLVVVLAGCGPPTLDSSSFKKLESSVTKLREPMDPEYRARFDEALTFFVGDAALIDEQNAEERPEHPELILALYSPLKGLTADGIIGEARLRRVEQVQTAVAELEQGRIDSEAARLKLKGFRLQASRVFKRNKAFLEWPVIEFKAENNTEEVVWLIHFRAALLRPGSEEPWLVEDFDQLVLEGLAPGERDLWRIEPEQQEWVTLIDPHPDFRFTLEVMRLEGLGDTVIAATEWGDIEAARLALY
ncbi:MAG: hypothetical protein MUP13_04810, partial [Thermoanaerobaculales bacterium]|nr:hypothetical protein [Thermoanaerobaculales bacterium]